MPKPSNTPASKDIGFMANKQKQFKSEFLKWLMKQMKEDSDGDYSGYSTDTSSKKHTTQEERAFIVCTTADASESDTSLEPSAARRLLRIKQLVKSNKSYWLQAAPGRLISEICVETINSTGRGTMLKGSLDSGCNTSIVLWQHVNKLTRGKKLKYTSTYYGGTATTSYSTKLQVKLIEFSHSTNKANQLQVPSEHQFYQEPLWHHTAGGGFPLTPRHNPQLWSGSHSLGWILGNCRLTPFAKLSILATPSHPTPRPGGASGTNLRCWIFQGRYWQWMLYPSPPSLRTNSRPLSTSSPFSLEAWLSLLKIKPVTIELQKDAKPYSRKY